MDKDGVGVVFDLGEPHRIDEVTLRTTLLGWQFQLRGSDDRTSFPKPIFSVEGPSVFTADQTSTTIRFLPVRFRYFLVWITELAEGEGGYQATIAEAQFSSG